MWLLCALLATFGWGVADIFYKKGAIQDEKYSHLKICIFIGLMMGLQSFIVLFTQHVDYNPLNIIYYLPVSLMYMLSMVFVFMGLKYIEISIASPLENTYGAMGMILCFFLLGQRMSILSFAGVVMITIGVVCLGIFQSKEESKTEKNVSKKMKMIAFSLSLLYAILEAFGVLFDAIYLDMSTTLLVDVTEANLEQVATISYGFTYLILAIVFFIYIKVKGDHLRVKTQGFKIGAACVEAISQMLYIYAMAGNSIITGPIVSAMCVVTLILGRIFLKEQFSKRQYASIFSVVCGIIIISIAEVL